MATGAALAALMINERSSLLIGSPVKVRTDFLLKSNSLVFMALSFFVLMLRFGLTIPPQCCSLFSPAKFLGRRLRS